MVIYMKEYIIIIAVFALLLFMTPVVFGQVNSEASKEDKHNGTDAHSASDASGSSTAVLSFPKTISLLLTDTDEAIEISIEEYLMGCLFAQIPVTYHEEALKAQAVAAHSYLLRLMADGVSVTDDTSAFQPFFTKETAREHYGDEYEKYSDKVKAAAEYGARHIMVYEGEPIYAVYHSVSAGVTNTAYSVWGRDFPYLQSVESSWDREHPDFHCVNEMTTESIRLAIYDYNKTASMPIDYSRWFVNPIRNDFGYVESIRVGENLLSGGDMWRIFSLRSVSFEISLNAQRVFVIETQGFGHGVGMSQYGADVLSRRGFLFDEILEHYYNDVTIITV
jgi:stage II sporulation protein D